MLRNSLSKFFAKKGWMALALPVWVLGSFAIVQLVIGFVYGFLDGAGVPFNSINDALLNTTIGAITYVLTIAMVIGLPILIKKYHTTRKDLGLEKYPSWLDLLLGPVGFVAYIVLSALLLWLAMTFLTFINFDQVQDTGFNQLNYGYEYVLAFVMLVVIAPVAEEVLFRGYLFGKLLKHVPVWVAVLVTSGIFALAHGAWNVGIDVFALSIVLCLLRLVSKSLWPSILLHMLKNGLAFYLLFINPTLLSTLGG